MARTTICLTLWQLTLMCFLLSWNTEFEAIWIDAWLSQSISIHLSTSSFPYIQLHHVNKRPPSTSYSSKWPSYLQYIYNSMWSIFCPLYHLLNQHHSNQLPLDSHCISSKYIDQTIHSSIIKSCPPYSNGATLELAYVD